LISPRDLLTRLFTALAMTKAAYLEVRRRRDLQLVSGPRVLDRGYAKAGRLMLERSGLREDTGQVRGGEKDRSRSR
jgi:hypothetical protein